MGAGVDAGTIGEEDIEDRKTRRFQAGEPKSVRDAGRPTTS